MKKTRVRHISIVTQLIVLTLASVAATCTAQSATLSPPPPIEKMLSEISAKRIEANIRTLVGFGTRSTLSDTSVTHAVLVPRGVGLKIRWTTATKPTAIA